MRALYSEGVRLLTACQLAQSPWQGGGVRVPAQLPPPVWSLEESPGSCGEGLLGGQGLQCVNVCIVCWVCIMREIKGQLQPERRGSQGEQGASWSMGLSDFCQSKGLCCRDSRTGVALVWVLLPPRANGNLRGLPSVHLSVCLSICILN